MEQVRVRFDFVGEEAQALQSLCSEEFRRPSRQAKYIVRQELIRSGWLSVAGKYIDKNESPHPAE